MRDKMVGIRPKVLVVGLDGADWKLLKPWMEKGYLPFLQSLVRRGVSGVLKSTFPTSSGPAWASIVTGKNPAKHGIAGWITHRGKTKIISSKVIDSRKLWNFLSERGIRCGVVNIPVTYPPEKLNGFMITGLLTPSIESQFTYPPELKNELGDYHIDIDLKTLNYGDSRDFKRLLEDQYRVTEKRINTIKKLLNRWDPDFFITNITGIDRVQHMYFDSKESLEYWQFVEDKLQDIIDTSKYEVFLISDHGFGKSAERYFHLNTWLEKEGFIKSTNRSFLKKLRELIYIVGKNLVDKINIINLEKFIPQHLKSKLVVDPYEISNKDEVVGVDLGIFINNKDIENYETLRDEIIKKLKKLKDPETGTNIIEKVWKKEEIFRGKYRIPDILIAPNQNYRINLNKYSKIVSKRNFHLRGDHPWQENGILIACGPDIKKGERVDAKIYGIAPTILHIFGLPIPNDMDGKVLMEIFKPDSEIAKRRPVYVDPSYYSEDTEKEKLKSVIKELKLKGKMRGGKNERI
ncbi:hypothetical protein CW713_01245 [Methanophagales archaeon]|nr:MAG: hypothetical protein CW713_01245 [Methanophagales archaeon]